jgi:hypothetical protein
VALRAIAVCLALTAPLALPAPALAHGRGPVVALDYRFRLASAPPGAQVRILDGDRSLEASVTAGRSLVVRGYLREQMLKLGPAGVFANAASPTAQADGIVQPGSGWLRVGSGTASVWHDHRLSPAGPGGRFSIPVEVGGRPGAIVGAFVRVPRPSPWSWLAGAAAAAPGIFAAARRRSARVPLATALGVLAGAFALAATVAFALRDRPGGGTAWVPVGAALTVAFVLTVPIVRLHGRRRARAAGVAGAVAAVVTIASLPVFWHGVVISALPPAAVRIACGLAFVAGAAAASLSLLREFDG